MQSRYLSRFLPLLCLMAMLGHSAPVFAQFWLLAGNAGTDVTANFLGTLDEQDLAIRTDNTERVRVTSRGRVGIGTDDPDRLLHVEIVDHFTDSISYAERLSHVTSGTPEEGFGAGFEFQIGGAAGIDATLGAIESVLTDATSGAEGGALRFRTTAGGDAGPSTRMTITEEGDVGVNTEDPSSRFVARNDFFGQRPLMTMMAGDETPFNISSTGSVTIDPVGAGVALRVFASSSLGDSNTTPVPFYVTAAEDVNAIYVTRDGDVGIGTAGEGITDRLRIQGPDNNGTRASVRIVSGPSQQTMLLDGNEIDGVNAGLFLNHNSEQNVVLATGGGNVGIGTSTLSQDAKLRVVHGNANGAARLHGPDNNGDDEAVLKLQSGAQTMFLDGNEIDALETGLFLNHNAGQNVVLATGGGNVGVGTTDPQQRLHVQGNADTDVLVTDDELARMDMVATEAAGDVTLIVQARSTNDDVDRAEIGTVSSHDMVFFANGATRLVIGSDGNVCIGNC